MLAWKRYKFPYQDWQWSNTCECYTKYLCHLIILWVNVELFQIDDFCSLNYINNCPQWIPTLKKKSAQNACEYQHKKMLCKMSFFLNEINQNLFKIQFR